MRYTYHLARWQAAATRNAYRRMLPTLSPVVPHEAFPRAVIAFSSASDLAEQVASLRSLLRYVGQPPMITIYSDGTHSAEQRALLKAQNPAVEVANWHDHSGAHIPDRMWRYSDVSPWGKKLVALMSMENRPTMYVDSDVLFFPGAVSGPELRGQRPFYLTDIPGGLDARVVGTGTDTPASAGMFLTSGALALGDLVAAHMPDGLTAADAFVEQALIHLALHRCGAAALPSETYVLHIDDHFRYRDVCRPDEVVMRHYIGMIRYKFWLAVGGTSLPGPGASVSDRGSPPTG